MKQLAALQRGLSRKAFILKAHLPTTKPTKEPNTKTLEGTRKGVEAMQACPLARLEHYLTMLLKALEGIDDCKLKLAKVKSEAYVVKYENEQVDHVEQRDDALRHLLGRQDLPGLVKEFPACSRHTPVFEALETFNKNETTRSKESKTMQSDIRRFLIPLWQEMGMDGKARLSKSSSIQIRREITKSRIDEMTAKLPRYPSSRSLSSSRQSGSTPGSSSCHSLEGFENDMLMVKGLR